MLCGDLLKIMPLNTNIRIVNITEQVINMYARDLIGKKVIRTKPNVVGDRSYSDHPIKIISSNSVIIFEYADDWHRKYMDTDKHSLGYEWNDDGWAEYEQTFINYK